ncbi:MMPL family transporter, partial [Streptomyces sp. URMC 126]
ITDVSIFSVNLTTALGLGLGIDYGLLLVSRFRERLTEGDDVPDALRTTVATAGRTIAFSAATVVAALAALLLFPPFFLRSFAYAGIGVVAIAAVGALVVVPA